jgi:phosphoribosylaminoimidazole-succinocarboxamide synthase
VDETLLGIGQMAQRSGLTISALRFYAGASVLGPDVVDPGTGYRRYRPAQLRKARLIAQLRRVGMPLPDIRRAALAVDEPAEVSRIIDEHLRRLEAGLADARRLLSTVPSLLDDLEEPVTTTLPIPHLHSGKVRDLYDAGAGQLLLVTTDRISAFDHVLPTEIPGKGELLCRLSLWWFEQLTDLVPNHVITGDTAQYPAGVAGHDDVLRGRSMLCRRLAMIPVECVARGYLAGSALADYERTGAVQGVPLSAGLVEGSRLPEPIFTPTTKSAVGEHDAPLTFDDVVTLVGRDQADKLRELTLALYRRAAGIAEQAGLILADTKFEFGLDEDGRIVLADEALTPDSTRYWAAETWHPGGPQPSFDKQFLRDWLTNDSGWDRVAPPPALPSDIVAAVHHRYVDAFQRLTGEVDPAGVA